MRRIFPVLIVTVALLVMSGCNFPLFAGESQPDEIDLLATSVAQTIQAMNAQPQATQPPAGQPAATTFPVQPTALPQFTQPAGPQPTSAANPCNDAYFLTETIPDDSEFAPGESFTKSWTFENEGTCTWNTNYKLVFKTGEQMGGPKEVSVPLNVAPGTQIKIDVPLKAPGTQGTYTGYWELQSAEGEGFFQVYVRIKVASVNFAVTSVYTNLKNISPVMCPHTYAVDVSIVTNGAGQVKYQTETSEGAVSGTKTLNFDAAGTKIVEFDWSGLGVDGSAADYWLKVYVGQPNNQTFGPFNFKVTCP